ncbi:hypothetical protein ACF1BQ_031890 [Bradyrhizobium sp. RDT10]
MKPMTPKRPRDSNQLAKSIIDIATGQVDEGPVPSLQKAKSGAKGGADRAARLTPEQRAEAARLAAQARWRRKED